MIAKQLAAERIGGLIWFVFGVAVVYGSWTMDRLESLNIPPATAPGLVPGLQGLAFIAFALVLLFRSRPPQVAASFAAGGEADAPDAEGVHWKRILTSWALCALYGGVLLGSGVHYWALTAAFLFLHIMLLDDGEDVPARPTLRRFLLAALMALSVATAVALVFRYIFLVRLP